ncbi:hypothetical protein IE077_002536 [Cardiosporidium cionae]|uniref:Uncharacterized protein n=1 Tax=Cardiosporidium cionae TaxID=476202 RepID=A0ABQ7JFK2_9APIC|nr:hypothetical protein IE077_002536 [Cardiosporidium cionae]|eukprot:KAF8822812.1 hypothetical protein IE077_002536 [Cardiosporidium cionae]
MEEHPSKPFYLFDLLQILYKKLLDSKSHPLSGPLKKANEKQLRLVIDGKLVLADSYADVEVQSLQLTSATSLVLFEGMEAVKALIETMAGRFAVEQWCVDIRKEKLKHVEEEIAKRKPYEEKCARWFYHPAPLKPTQLVGWRDYLDFEENKFEEFMQTLKKEENDVSSLAALSSVYPSLDFLYARCLEICVNYVEFWRRRAQWLEKKGFIEDVKVLYTLGCSVMCRHRPDLLFEFAEFCERFNDIDMAKHLYEKVEREASTTSYKKLLDVWLRPIAFYRRQNETSKCVELYEKANEAIKDPQKRAVLVMDESNFYIKQMGLPQSAL